MATRRFSYTHFLQTSLIHLILVYISIVMAVEPTKAVGPCITDEKKCPNGSICVDDQCYNEMDVNSRVRRPISKINISELPTVPAEENNENITIDEKSTPSIGSCVNDLCPANYKCIDNACHKLVTIGKRPIGKCINERCPENYSCDLASNMCYP